ncbi:MAG: MBL fold metallo-hydrolase [Parasphingopyxis sp.]|uniref:MBL fold metallo-hydrolase n=1 Tax=Parasphingopyxis sp. TaxID=1920299 RepID=UPI003FA13542
MANRHLRIDRRALLRTVPLAGAALAASAALPLRARPTDRGPATLRRLNWAGIMIEHGDAVVYVDAVRPDDGETVDASSDRRVKYALVSHAHGDHYDPSFLSEIMGDRGVLFHHEDVVVDQRPLRLDPVAMWQPVFMPRSGADIVAFPVPASDGFGDVQVSWVIECNSRRLIHCGDTLWHGRFWDIGQAYGPFDWAFLPINGAQQQLGRFEMLGVPGVLTPEQAVAAARALRAETIVPIHYGGSAPPVYVEEADAESRLGSAARDAGISVRIMAAGEELTF